jgi:hypothetical protein
VSISYNGERYIPGVPGVIELEIIKGTGSIKSLDKNWDPGPFFP